MSKKAIEIKNDEKATVAPVSETRASRQALVDAYAKKHPTKYEDRKKALEAWVASV